MPKKVPSYLKGLVETRARAAGDLERYTRIMAEVSAKVAGARAEIDACDRLIRKFDARLKPELIEPLRTHRYGGRGGLRAALVEYLQAVYPAAATSTEIAFELQIKFGFDFQTADERDRWLRGAMTRALKDLSDKGLVERLHDPAARNGKVGRWRFRTASNLGPNSMLDKLAAAGEELAEESDVSCRVPVLRVHE
jgi:hypothetical protein